jgi:nicotinamidase-related amidase
MNPALVIIDVQKQFYSESEANARSLTSAVQVILPVLELFHKKGLPVVFVQNKNEEEGLIPGNEGFDLPDDFIVEPGDIRITKTYSNAFNKTGLAEKLKCLGVDTVILTGFCAEWCVLSTYRGAWDVDLEAMLLRGSLASPSEENIRFVEQLGKVLTLDELVNMLAE